MRGDDVCFDYRLLDTSGQSEIDVEVAIASKAILHGYERQIREIGLVPRIFTIAGSPLKFSPAGIPWTRQKQLQTLLAIGGIFVWAAAFWFAPVARDDEIADLHNKIVSLRPIATTAQAQLQELDRYQLPPAAISPERQRVLEVLMVLTKGLPSSVHVTEFTMADGAVFLSGTAPPSLRIGALLVKTKLFGRIEYPKVARFQDINHFELKATLRPTPSTGPHDHEL